MGISDNGQWCPGLSPGLLAERGRTLIVAHLGNAFVSPHPRAMVTRSRFVDTNYVTSTEISDIDQRRSTEC